jgi:hypothetical protein
MRILYGEIVKEEHAMKWLHEELNHHVSREEDDEANIVGGVRALLPVSV